MIQNARRSDAMCSDTPAFVMDGGENRDAPLIAHVIFRLDVGGLENGLVNLLNHSHANAYRHAVICLKDYSDFRDRIYRKDVEVYALHKREGKDLRIYFKLWKLFKRLRPDIVHTRNLSTLDCLFPAALAGVGKRVHGEHGWDVFDLGGTSFKFRFLRRVCQPLVTRYVALSRDLESWLAGTVGIPASKIVHICNGVDAEKFRPAGTRRGTLQFTNPIPDDAVVFGTVGRMEAVKDHITLAKAFVRLVAARPSFRERARLAVVGDGASRPEVRRILEEGGVADLVCMPGTRDDVAEMLWGFDVFVLPSLNEGISNTVLEAMATGLPVVATDVGGNSELVVNGETGTLVPPSEPEALRRALSRYLERPKLRREHGEAARARVERHFSLDEMVRKYVSVYDSMLGVERRELPGSESGQHT